MKALVLTSTGLRHRYFAQTISGVFDVIGVLAEEKRNYYTAQREQSAPVRAHFECIAAAEKEWFALDQPLDLPFRSVADMNDAANVAWAVEQKPDVICLFGTTILGSAWLEAFSARIVNLHLGLSPYYRGSATLFWPFVNRELQYLGTTIHLAIAKVDAGNILARIEADLQPGESYYEITSRLIRDSIQDFPRVVADYLSGAIVPHPQELIDGRLYRKADFDENALKQALDYAGNGLSEAEISRIKEIKACLYSP